VPLWASARTCEFNAVWEWGMTKNEDTSPWMRFPDNPKAIKRHNELVLSSIPTADLVAELSKRDGVEYADIECDDGVAKTIVIHGWVRE